jgi:uncharacterized protein with NAD-binding domain and iron-sulfur cluster
MGALWNPAFYMGSKPIRVAIVGGGCAGVTAAFELTRPALAGRYEVTVHQVGWRLGGKGASGRGPSARIEEHGLHLWMGFYENAFRLMRECYAELGRDKASCPISDWTDAFVPDPVCGVMDRTPRGEWLPWTVTFPPTPGAPGDSGVTANWTVADYLQRSISLVRTLLETVRRSTLGAAAEGSPREPGPVGLSPSEAARLMVEFMKYGGLASLSALIQALGLLDEVARLMPRFPSETILRFHAAIAEAARAQVERMTQGDPGLRRLWEVIELVLATIRGIIRFGLVTDPKGFDAIDEYDCREWLRLNGASERAVDSAFLRALYDLAFAYEDGDVKRPRIAAGQALRGAVRAFFTYRGAFFWKMQAGMGDIVFAPFYEVLARRGVRFDFFRRLKHIGLSSPAATVAGKSPYVEQLVFDVQAEVLQGGAYRPLVDVGGLPCWPSEPDWSQLVEGARLERERRQFESHWDARTEGERVLHVGQDFDFVVLAVGIGAVPLVCRELVERDPRWQRMVERVKSVPTQALQLWLNQDAATLGWSGPSANVSGFVEPFDTWADMPQLIEREAFRDPVKAVAYFCSVLPDAKSPADAGRDDYPERRQAEVRENAIEFLNRHIGELWPNAVKPGGGFRWELLVDAHAAGHRRVTGRATSARIDTQYLRANVEPSDRYVLSLPGTLAYRLSPLDLTCDNLTVAGDWTACGFMEGCVEAAVMSGRLAAHALSKQPPLEEIVGYDHP